ncbi:MAG TPA: YlmH/Sll1252 family protein [Bacillota bacterium]|nr:YlmH/Sll1252 family protein [Bacillota bacterium]
MTTKDRDALLKMAQSDDERILIAKALDRARQAELTGDFVTGDFHDPAELSRLTAVFAHRSGTARLHSYGGHPRAERKRAVFSPDGGAPDIELYKLCAIEVRQRDSDARFVHPALLGALMSQGIKREKIGDIVVGDGLAWIIMDESLAERVTLTSVGRDAVTCSTCDLSALADYSPEMDSQTVTVASLRLDAVLAAVFNLSRSDAVAAVNKGMVKVNHVPEDSVSRTLKEGDLVSLRGQGRTKLARIAGETRKGRIRLEMERPRR